MSKYKIFTTPIGHEQFRGVRVTPNVATTLPELDRFAQAPGEDRAERDPGVT